MLNQQSSADPCPMSMRSLLVLLLASCAGAMPCPGGVECIWKCCPEGKVIVGPACVPGEGRIDGVPHGVKRFSGKPSCEMYYLSREDNHSIHLNGTVTQDGGEPEHYCVEFNELNETFTYVCFPDYPDDYMEVNKTNPQTLKMYSAGLFFSAPFLLATFVVYAFFLRFTFHNYCVTWHTLSMLLSYIALALAQNEVIQDYPPCMGIGYAIQFFFMATFFWLNVMCFDIYWAFSGLKNLTGSVKERERKKLILYSCYAWGLPLLILLVTVGIDNSSYVPDDSIFKPGVGIEKCFFQKDLATGIYFYMPMGFVLVINIILFSITAYRICTLRRETAVLKRGDSRKHDSTNDKERFSLYLKLFLVMGINWVMELVSYLVMAGTDVPQYIWYIPDFTNTLQGVFIFIIFVWKERVRRMVWAKIKSFCGCEVANNTNQNQWATSTRNNSSLTNSSGVTNNSIKMTPVNNGVTSQPSMA